jgi:hypothetical protein
VSAELQEIRELRRDLQDVTTALEGIGCELEKLVLIQHGLATFKLGDDPLSDYYERGVLFYQNEDVVPPQWVSKHAPNIEEPFPPPERNRGGMAAAIVFVSVVVSVIVVVLFTLFWIGNW